MTIIADDKWYKPICQKCPYFVMGEAVGAQCVRPDRYSCLGNTSIIRNAEAVIQLKLLQEGAEIKKKAKESLPRKKLPPLVAKFRGRKAQRGMQ